MLSRVFKKLFSSVHAIGFFDICLATDCLSEKKIPEVKKSVHLVSAAVGATIKGGWKQPVFVWLLFKSIYWVEISYLWVGILFRKCFHDREKVF